MLDLSLFDWGWMNVPSNRTLSSGNITKNYSQWHKDAMIQEIFQNKMYEKFFEIEEGDIVADFGASIGPFTYSILHKNPKHVYCFEPSSVEWPTLENNTKNGPVTIIKKAIASEEGIFEFNLFGSEKSEFKLNNLASSTTFTKFIEEYNINKIDFIKTDCEGGEYSIFNVENLSWIKQNVKKIVGEWHLCTPEEKLNFIAFRDLYLKEFPNHHVYSVDNINIKWDLWNEHFIEYYCQVLVYIDNR